MRPLGVFLTAICIVLPGCASSIALSGKRLDSVTSSQEVHNQLGTPIANQDVDGQHVEVYRTHQKIADPGHGEEWMMAAAITLGLSELVMFPYETFRAVRDAANGRDVRVTYDEGGNVTKTEVDGHVYSQTDSAAAKKAGVP